MVNTGDGDGEGQEGGECSKISLGHLKKSLCECSSKNNSVFLVVST